MKIRTMLRLFALCMSICLCLSPLAACDTQTEGETQAETPSDTVAATETRPETDTDPITETEAPSDTEPEQDTEDSLDSTDEAETDEADPCTVTREEWVAALNFAVPATSTEQYVWWPKSETDPEDRFIYYDVVQFGEDVLYTFDWDETFTNVHDQFYYVKDGENYYVCQKIMGEWVWEPSSQASMEHRKEILYGWDGEFGLSGEFLYDDFTYDKAKEAYVCAQMDITTGGETMTYHNIELKFRDGILESFYLEGLVDGYVAAKTSIGYGPVEIVLPERAS